MENVTITSVTLAHIGQLQKIGKQTFFDTYSADNTPENMERYLKEKFSLETLTAELNDQNTAFYFASNNNDVIGYLKLNFGTSQTAIKDDKALEIERIYVLRTYQGKGVGQLLYNKAIQVAKQNGKDYVWLGVWEKNPRAIRFYEKNGFVIFDKHLFQLGDDLQKDFLMKYQLKGN